MAVERKGFRLTDFTLDYVPGDGEQHGDIEVSNLVFIADGPSQILPLTHLLLNQWVAKDNAAVCLSEEAENVIVVLQGKELDDVANVILSQQELLEKVPTSNQGGRGMSIRLFQRIEMEDLSMYAETGRWFLSWEAEAVDMSPLPVPAQPDENCEVEHETQNLLDVAEAPFTSIVQPAFENHMELDEEALHLTDITVIYTPEDVPDSASVEVTKMVLFSGEDTWTLQLVGSSPNRWGVEGNVNIPIPKDAESLTVSLQDEDLEDVALAFILLREQEFRDGAKTSRLESGLPGLHQLVANSIDADSGTDCISETEMASMSGSGGRWSVAWKVELVDASRRRDEDLASRWKQLEALFPWEVAVDSPSLRQSMEAFVAHDADAYGHDILLQQAYAVQQKNKCKYTDDIAAIEEAIDIQTMLVVDPRVQQSRQMHAIATSHLGAMHHERFNQTMLPKHLDQAISLLQTAIEYSSPQTNIHAECLCRLGQGYHTRYQSTSNLDDSVAAIIALSEACDISRHNSHFLESNLDHLFPSLQEYVGRGNRTAMPLAGAIACLRRVMQSFTGGPTHALFRKMTALAAMLGLLLKAHCKETQALDELNNAIDHYRVLLALLRHLPSTPYYYEVLHDLTNALKDRYLKTEDPKDLDEAILTGSEALASASSPFDQIGVGLLAILHFLRYQTLKLASDLDKSISLQRRLLNSKSSDDPSYGDALITLAEYLRTQIMVSSTESNIDEALAIISEGSGPQDSDRYFLMESFQALSWYQKFRQTGTMEHLTTATSIMLQSRCHTSSDRRLKLYMASFVTTLRGNYERLGQAARETGAAEYYAHKIVACNQKCTALSDTPKVYHQLGASLLRRHRGLGLIRDLQGAIEALSTSLRMSEANDDQPSPDLFLDLARAIESEGLVNNDTERHAQAKELVERALLCSEEHEQAHSRALVRLIEHIMSQWIMKFFDKRSHNDNDGAELTMQDISEIHSDQAIIEELLLRVPTNAPDYPRGQETVLIMRIILARLDQDRRNMDGYRDLAIQELRTASSSTQGTALHRFFTACSRVNMVADGAECLEAYDTAIGILAMVVGLGQRITERHSLVTDSGGNPRELSALSLKRQATRLPLEAAAKAAQYHSTDKALEWLEQGRCFVWNQLQTLRTPLDHLERQNPRLAQRIRHVSTLLDGGKKEGVVQGNGEDLDLQAKVALEEESATRARASKEWDELLKETREIPGFEDFLRPTRCSTLLQHLPESGPVIVLNAHELRCDAIVLSSGMDEPLLVPLPKTSYSRAKEMQQVLKEDLKTGGMRMREALVEDFGKVIAAEEGENEQRGVKSVKFRSAIEHMLQELWESVVKPVLDALAFNTKSAKPTTRIWWCTTGPFSFLPIHAAGVYGRGTSSECLADYAVSSYTPTVSALTARVREKREHNARRGRVLLVSVPDAEGQAAIPGTTREVQSLLDFARANNIDHLGLEGKEATAESVMEEISKASVVHLACHGSQNVGSPMESGFYLHDKRLELSTIVKANLKEADLAFLSACQTGTGDEGLSNEAVHLAAGMMAAGFRGTVATMWAISDVYAPKVAEDFYKDLAERGKAKDRGIDGEDAAFALHYATQELKKRLGRAEKSFLTWVPYVHYGI